MGGLLALGVLALLADATARAQNLDRGKSATKLFAEDCASCHRNARGLAKGRLSLTLYFFLKQHYVSNSESAWALTSYLESVDTPQRGTTKPPARHAPRSATRPPMPVPQR